MTSERSGRGQGVSVLNALTALGLMVCALPLAGAAGGDGEGIPVDDLPDPLPREVPFGLPDSLLEGAASDPVVSLGRRLFFDPVLSLDRSVACASCHDPALGFADARPFSLGIGGQTTRRNSPTLLNRALGKRFMWDGRAATLEEQVLMPIADPREMGLAHEEAVARLVADASYGSAFEEAFDGPPTQDRLASALAGFVRRMVRGASRVDLFRRGDFQVLDAEERGGLWLFESRGGCWRCHSGPNFSDEKFHNTGVEPGYSTLGRFLDDGRYEITQAESDRAAFKTPTLRGVGETAPYMHDGSLDTLAEVVEFYRDGGHQNPYLDALIAPVEMSDQDVINLVAFLKAM